MSMDNVSNGTVNGTIEDMETITKDDAAWILANSFLILTMQTGFGMLEAGSVSPKNVANIMVKNVVDVSLGGILYWSVGYGLSYGEPSNAFCGFGSFFLTDKDTSWAWNSKGWLAQLGFFDFAGACVVHLNGGASALVASLMLGPRLGRFGFGDSERDFQLSSPVTALTGTFMLWWAWLAFNCGSTFGITGVLWKTAAKSAINTINGSVGGSLVGLVLSWLLSPRGARYFDIGMMITGILGGLVGITGLCSVVQPAEAIGIGMIGGAIAVLCMPLMEKLKIDDPVGAVPVHFASAIWSTLAVGLFAEDEFGALGGNNGLFKGGGWYLLGVQALGVLAVAGWAAGITGLIFAIMNVSIGVRMSRREELLGADWTEHNVRSDTFANKLERAVEELKLRDEDVDKIIQKMSKELFMARRQSIPGRQHSIDARILNVAGPSVPGASPWVVPGLVDEIRRGSIYPETETTSVTASPPPNNASESAKGLRRS